MGVYFWVNNPLELCFTANTAGSTVQLTKIGTPTEVSLETSTDGMIWNDYTIGDSIALSNIGDKVYMRNKSETDTGFSLIGMSNYYKFVMTGSIAASGDITYLLNKNGTTALSNGCFHNLFMDCSALTSSPKFTVTTLSSYCYSQIFQNCTSLVTPPELPATTLAYDCYSGMFQDCSALTTAPSLPATILDEWCYSAMFIRCTSLTEIPKLPATTLTNFCYFNMFNGCTNIKLSTSYAGIYQTSYRIPTGGGGSGGNEYSLMDMFSSTGGTFTGTPTINKIYYTSNTVV